MLILKPMINPFVLVCCLQLIRDIIRIRKSVLPYQKKKKEVIIRNSLTQSLPQRHDANIVLNFYRSKIAKLLEGESWTGNTTGTESLSETYTQPSVVRCLRKHYWLCFLGGRNDITLSTLNKNDIRQSWSSVRSCMQKKAVSAVPMI